METIERSVLSRKGVLLFMAMTSAAWIREQCVWMFEGKKPLINVASNPTAESMYNGWKSWRSWPASWSVKRLHAQGGWQYALIHSDAPLKFYTRLYAIKEPSAVHGSIVLHKNSLLELWKTSSNDIMPWNLSITGTDERDSHVEWVVRLCGDENQARLCYRVLQVRVDTVSYTHLTLPTKA